MKIKWYRFVLYILLTSSCRVLCLFPRVCVQRMADVIGTCVYYALGKERVKVRRHLAFAYADALSDAEVSDKAKKVFINFAQVLGDLILLSRMSVAGMSRLVVDDPSNTQRFQQALKKENGVIFVAAHIGNWELMAAYVANNICGDVPVTVIGRRIYYERYNKVLVDLRKRFGVETVYRDSSFKSIVRTLKRGECVGILPDQDVDSIPGIFVDFFGKPAYTTDSPARLAYMTGAVIVPAFMVRDKDVYRLFMDEPIEFNRDNDKDAEIRAITQKLSSIIEKYVRQNPEQWGWMHNRWKTKQDAL